MELTNYFDKDKYTTPPETRRFLLDRLPFGRFSLWAKFAFIVLRANKKAVSNIYDDEQWAKSSYKTLKTIEGCGGRFNITGLENVRSLKGPVVFISNHMSTLETLVFPVLIVQFRKVTYVVKEKLVQGPLFGPIMRSRNPITVGRVDPKKDLSTVLTKGKELIEDGYSIIIFPQSTRREVFSRRQFNSLGVKLALHAGVDIVPIAVKTDFWSNGKYRTGFGPIRRNRPIHIAFGPRLTPIGRGRNEHHQVVEFIENHLKAWGAIVETVTKE